MTLNKSDGEALGMCCTPLLLLLPGPLWLGVVEHDRFLSMGQIELFDVLVWFLCLMAYKTFFRLFNAKAILLEEQLWYYLTHSWEDKEIHTFPKGINPKVNIIARLEYKPPYYDSAVHQFNHYTKRTPSHRTVWHLNCMQTKDWH